MKDKTLYIVSGFMRCGTSMMMKALEFGGMETAYSQNRDEMKKRFADEQYDPNIGGLYELEKKHYMHPNFPNDYKGKLIKFLNLEHRNKMGIGKSLPVMDDGIRVIFMKRDPEEIRQSYDAFFGHQLDSEMMDDLENRFERCIKNISNRKDVKSLHVFNYRDVVENPIKYFNILRDDGWNINPLHSALVVNKKYYRFRKEELDPGVI